MSLSDDERAILEEAGGNPSPVDRQRAVGIYLAKSESERAEAADALVEGFLNHLRPSFHLIPKGDSMADEESFNNAYAALAAGTGNFSRPDSQSLATVLQRTPAALAPLRMVVGLTHNELAVAIKLTDQDARVSGEALKKFERNPPPSPVSARHKRLAVSIANAATAAMSRRILTVPPNAAVYFHSKLDKRDTREGWSSVQSDAGGVPYSALLYQRYVGGVWRQVQDAYSEVKGDAILEYPLRDMLNEHHIPHHHTRPGPSGAQETAERYGISPGPDFVIPDEAPTVVVESKVGEDGGTVRDKADRIKSMTRAADARGLRACAVVDGKGWTERTSALLEVIVATQGRTYTLSTLSQLLHLAEIRALTTDLDR
ncbi:MAG: hypothetical protein F4110_04720 [Acidimicrobiaceae bacterium]|nr:hypothetical protein [Acidimicrobiaceae bacterium]MYE96626.1 hypothetical protein [Acidimicrobiaceae bacterium]MYH43385.1 hypothetical protein [Acidimicrobiaceae bacterium]MYI53275.1 hypothetical protein [Acidimicrobiaceae bacterium]MYK73168.1 hypothetical protein [Acidimicrobiaceae bacterium]